MSPIKFQRVIPWINSIKEIRKKERVGGHRDEGAMGEKIG